MVSILPGVYGFYTTWSVWFLYYLECIVSIIFCSESSVMREHVLSEEKHSESYECAKTFLVPLKGISSGSLKQVFDVLRVFTCTDIATPSVYTCTDIATPICLTII